MKSLTRIIFGIVLAVATISCRDKAAEKKIAELEARISQMEANKTAQPAAPVTDPAAATTAPESKPDGPLPVIKFETIDHDFGTIKEGDKVNYVYKFTNTGEAPLIVQNVQPSCGCTAPDWSREPIPVNGTGFVKVEFDSNAKTGIQNKTITVSANTWPKTLTLKFKAMVLPKPTGANGPVK